MKTHAKSPWRFVPSLYFIEGVPYSVVMILSIIMYKRLGVANSTIAFWTSILNLPWVFKPLWSPLVDMYWTKRGWIWWMQILLAATFGLLAFGVNLSCFFVATISVLSSVAILSATHDIAADGFYIHALDSHNQALFSGIRNTFYRISMIFCQGVLVIAAGYLESHTGLGSRLMEASVVDSSRITHQTLAAPQSQHEIVLNTTSLTVTPGKSSKVEIKLASPPAKDKAVNVTFGRKSGSKLIVADENSMRFKFNSKNWQTPQFAVVKALPEAKPGSTAQFRICAGNIPLSWSLVLGFLGLFTLCLGIYHRFALPFPKTDTETKTGIGGFIKSVFVLAVAVGIPAVALKYLFSASAGIMGKIQSLLPAHLQTAANIKLVLTLAQIALPILLVYAIFKIAAVRSKTHAAIAFMTQKSGLCFDEVFMSFFKKPQIKTLIAFLLLYRLAEAQLTRIAAPFMLDAQEKGGLALDTAQIGFIYGGVGLFALLAGGILGGILVSRSGLKKWLYFMWAAINVPDAVYLYMAHAQPADTSIISACVAVEQFGYGMGFTGYMIYMLYIAGSGQWKVAHYAICTGFMALGMMLPGMVSGYIQEMLGYKVFFAWVLICTLPALWVIGKIPLDKTFGTKADKKTAG